MVSANIEEQCGLTLFAGVFYRYVVNTVCISLNHVAQSSNHIILANEIIHLQVYMFESIHNI